MRICLCFLILKKMHLGLKLTWNLIKKETKMNDHSIESRGLSWKYFCEFLVIWMFFVIFEYWLN